MKLLSAFLGFYGFLCLSLQVAAFARSPQAINFGSSNDEPNGAAPNLLCSPSKILDSMDRRSSWMRPNNFRSNSSRSPSITFLWTRPPSGNDLDAGLTSDNPARFITHVKFEDISEDLTMDPSRAQPSSPPSPTSMLSVSSFLAWPVSSVVVLRHSQEHERSLS
jgi:hypothetical protein